jgi:hypothetical protein
VPEQAREARRGSAPARERRGRKRWILEVESFTWFKPFKAGRGTWRGQRLRKAAAQKMTASLGARLSELGPKAWVQIPLQLNPEHFYAPVATSESRTFCSQQIRCGEDENIRGELICMGQSW